MPALRLRSGPAPAGIQGEQAAACGYSAWIPAFAVMTRHSSTPQNHHDRLLNCPHFIGGARKILALCGCLPPSSKQKEGISYGNAGSHWQTVRMRSDDYTPL